MSYQHFSAAVYCPVGNLIGINNLDEFAERFEFIRRNVQVNKVYLETFRAGEMIERDKMIEIKKLFQNMGIKTSGGITTADNPSGDGGFDVFCYTNPKNRERLKAISEFTAELFDEVILDDFYFTNCKCESCIRAKGNRSWAQFRTELMKDVSENIIVGPAKKVNPNINMIIKYPNWYEHYQESGYNLKDEPKIFDSIYTGTETRNPQYTQQHLPKYLSYFNIRYMEHVKPGKNLGGWFDPYECNYNLTSYADQAYLTLFAKAREATLFSLGSLLEEEFSLCVPVAGQVFSDLDKHLGRLGNPVGTACYLPYHSSGEDYLHNYIGMLGIPLEPSPDYPENAHTIFLTESAAKDEDIIEKVKISLLKGATVIVTSAFARATQGRGLASVSNIHVTDRKAAVNQYAYSMDGGVCFGSRLESAASMIIPQVEYPTNDTWELIGAFGEDNSFPLLLKTKYGKGKLYVLTIPDDCGNLYHLPSTILKPIRECFAEESEVMLDGTSKISLFTYDNNTFILRSFQPFIDHVGLIVKKPHAKLKNLITGKTLEGRTDGAQTIFEFILPPSSNRMFQII